MATAFGSPIARFNRATRTAEHDWVSWAIPTSSADPVDPKPERLRALARGQVSGRRLDGVLALLLFACVYFVLQQQDPARFHIDEASKVSESHYYHLMVENRDFRHPDWRDDFFARVNPPIAKYLMGAGLSLQGQAATDGRLQQKFEQLWQEPGQLRESIPTDQLMAARRVTALFAAACCAIVFLIARSVAGRTAGLIAVSLLVLHPLFLEYCSLALSDSILLFFMSATVPLLLHVLRRSGAKDGDRHAAIWEIVLPTLVLLGAAGTKLNGGLAAILWILAVGCVGLSHPWGAPGRRLWRTLHVALLPPLLALGLFVALNPSLYDRPLQSLIEIPRVYADWMLKQTIDPGAAIVSFQQRWAETYFHTSVRGELPLHAPAFPFSVLLWLALVGVAVILHGLIATWRERRAEPTWIVITLWIVVYGVGIAGWIPVDWDRYFLPLIPLQAVLAGIGVFGILRAVRWFVAVLERTADPTPPTEVRRTALMAGGALALALGIAAVTDLSLVAPHALQVNGIPAHDVRASLQRAIRNHPDDPVRLLHLADFLDARGLPKAALPHAQRALALLPADEPRRAFAALRASCLLKLARIEERAGHPVAATEYRLESNRQIAAILSGLPTHDPMVDKEFQQIGARAAPRAPARIMRPTLLETRPTAATGRS